MPTDIIFKGDPIRIHLHLPLVVAAALGTTRYGDMRYEPSEEEWAAITPEERLWLVGGQYQPHAGINVETKLTVHMTPVTWESIVVEMRTRMAARAADALRLADIEAKDNLAIEAHVDALFARPFDAWFREDDYSGETVPNIPVVRLQSGNDWRARSHPRVAAFLEGSAFTEECNRRNDARRAERKAREDAITLEAEQRRARTAATVAAALLSFEAYAVTRGGVLARAVREEYDITQAVVDDVVDSVRLKLAEQDLSCAAVLREGTRAYADASWEDRQSPTADAFDVLDKATSAIEKIAHPDAMTVEVLRIQRFERPASQDDEEFETVRMTAVLVDINSPISCRTVLVLRAER